MERIRGIVIKTLTILAGFCSPILRPPASKPASRPTKAWNKSWTI